MEMQTFQEAYVR